MGTSFRNLGLLMLGAALAGCASEPALEQREIARIHTARVVYIRQQSDFAIFQVNDYSGVITMLALNYGFAGALAGNLLLPPTLSQADAAITDDFLYQHQDTVSTFRFQDRLQEAVADVIPRVPWLNGVPQETRYTPMTAYEMQQYVRDAGVDAVIFLYPVSGLDVDGTRLYVYLRVSVYANPHTDLSPFKYDSVNLGCLCKLVIPDQDPKKAFQSIYGISLKQRFQVWFANDASVLRQDADRGISQAHDELAHYLGALPTTKAPCTRITDKACRSGARSFSDQMPMRWMRVGMRL